MNVLDPLKFASLMWPQYSFYRQQREIIYSVLENKETVVPAGNMLGKDFISGFIVLWFFLSRHPCRVITTSVKDDHLRVLWGEIGRFIQQSKYPLDVKYGGPLIVNHHELRKIVAGQPDALSYVKGMVAKEGAAMQGHHVAVTGDGIPRTLFVVDEASGVPDVYYKMASTWAHRILIIGNPWNCENFFKYAVKGKPGSNDHGGDLLHPSGRGYTRRVIKITAEDSPNVRYARAEIKVGRQPTDTIIVPGVKPYYELLDNRARWDKIQQCVSLDAEFYEGPEIKLYPPEWLNAAEERARALVGTQRKAKTLGVDSAQGGDNTSFAISDELGLLHLESCKTADTSVIPARTLALMREWNIMPENVLFDAGGGGKQHADRLRAQGYAVRTVAFGESAHPELKRGLTTLDQKRLGSEVQYIYRNRRAEMYGLLRQRLDPANLVELGKEQKYKTIFAMPSRLANRGRDDGGASLRNQLSPIPLQYDEEGRLYLPPKNKRDPDQKKPCLVDMIGCSPDEADALVLSVYGLEKKATKAVAGVMR